MIPVFIGFDPRQPVAAQVAAYSVAKNAGSPVSVTLLRLPQLAPFARRGLTDFTYSRFLVPWVCDFKGHALFIDSDVLVRGDVAEMMAYAVAYPEEPVFMVEHTGRLKFERPSVMLFNCAKLKHLTPEFVSTNPMFDFKWASSIGKLKPEWNHLVGYDAPNPNAKLAHFTRGIPIWPETKDSEFASEWWATCNEANSSVSYADLMSKSVHAQPEFAGMVK